MASLWIISMKHSIASISTLALCISVVITGCATTQSFTTSMNKLKGQSASKLIKEFGAPDQRIDKNGQTTLIFRPIITNIPIPAASSTQISGMRSDYSSPRASSIYGIRANCRVAFTLENNQVIDWVSQGKECPNQ